jgi:ribokinase
LTQLIERLVAQRVDPTSGGKSMSNECMQAFDSIWHPASADVSDLGYVAELFTVGQIRLVGMAISLGEAGVAAQPPAHRGHQPSRLQGRAGGMRPRARQVVRGRERRTVGEPWRGGHHRRLAARTPIGQPSQPPGRPLQLRSDDLDVFGGQRLEHSLILSRDSWTARTAGESPSPAGAASLACTFAETQIIKLSGVAGRGVAVVGSINADLTAYGSPLPRPGETVIADDFGLALGGKGANQAVAASRAGAETYMIGAVGNDIFRELTLERLTAEGVDTSAVQVLDGHTGIAHIRVDTMTGQNDIAVVPNANSRLTIEHAEDALRRLKDRVAIVLIQLEIPIPVIEMVAALSHELGLELIVDPAPALSLPTTIWGAVSVVKPNEIEAELITGIRVADRQAAVRAGRWFLDHGTQTALLTMAERGAVVVHDDRVEELPAFLVQPVDTTAAGDAFAGALGAALAQERPWSDAVRRAMAAGALAVTVRGATPSLPTADQIDDFLTTHADR